MADDGIWIESTRAHHDQENACLIRWDGIERYATVADVRSTAEDLFTCAAYAEIIGKLIRMDASRMVVMGLMQELMKNRKPRHFGAPTTLFLLPAGSSKRKLGVVLLGKRDLFHKGKADAELSPDEAREMGRYWLAVAEASDADSTFGQVLEHSGWMQAAELNALFSLLSDIRAGKAEIPPPPAPPTLG